MLNKKSFCMIGYLAAALISTPSLAYNRTGCCPLLNSFPNWLNPLVSVSVGTAKTNNIGNGKTFVVDDSTYNYSSGQSSNKTFFGGFIGTEIPWQQFALDVGLGFYEPQTFSVDGTLVQGADAFSSDTYNYSYSIKSRQILVEGKLLWNCINAFHPYVSLGLGEVWNDAYGYTANFNRFLTFSPLYSNRSSQNFSYSAGVGFDVDVACHLRLGVGYRYNYLGKAKLGNGVIDTTPIGQNLSTGTISSNAIIGQVTWLFF